MGTDQGRIELMHQYALIRGKLIPKYSPLYHHVTQTVLAISTSSFPSLLHTLKSNICFNWSTETTLPLCHGMLSKTFSIHIPTPFSVGSPEFLVYSFATYSLFVMLLNNGLRYLLVHYIFIEHLQCIRYFAGYRWQKSLRQTLSPLLWKLDPSKSLNTSPEISHNFSYFLGIDVA